MVNSDDDGDEDSDGNVDDGGFLIKVNLVIISCDDDGDPAECKDNGWW